MQCFTSTGRAARAALAGLFSVTVAMSAWSASAAQPSRSPFVQAPQAAWREAGVAMPSTDRIIVKYKGALAHAAPDPMALSRVRVAGNRQGVQLGHLRRTGLGADVFRLSKHVSLAQARAMAEDLQNSDASVEYAEPDRILHPAYVPNDTFYSSNYEWNLSDVIGGINAEPAWDKTTGAGVVVAVLDTGVRPHADLAANLLPGRDFIADTKVSNDGDGRDADASDPGDAVAANFCASGSVAKNSSWHGTHVAGIVGAVANNGVGVAGVAFGAKVLPVRTLGRCGGYTSDFADGLIWAVGGTVANVPANPKPARVINVSLGGQGLCDITAQRAIDEARARGAVVVVAAGNTNEDASGFTPANCTGVIVVAATGHGGGKASYSNHGAIVTLAAPGGDDGEGIVSTFNAGTTVPGADSYGIYMGTSMAVPHVSGVVALMLARNPSLTPDQVRAKLQSTARAFPTVCEGCGAGIVDASAAVNAVGTNTAPAAVVKLNETEPNNTAWGAQVLPAGNLTVSGEMASASDFDYFAVSIPAGRKLTVTLTPNASSNYDLYGSKDDGSYAVTASRNAASAPDAISLTNSAAAAVKAWVRVNRVSGLTGAGVGTYTLFFAYAPL